MRQRVISVRKRGPRHEAGDECYLCGFQLIRIQKAAHARQIRHELSVVRLPAKSYRIESIDKVTALLNFLGLEEELRHMDTVALGGIAGAVVAGAYPAV